MKARLLKDTNEGLKLLCPDGTIADCTDHLLYDLLTGFKNKVFSNGEAGRWDDYYPDMMLYPGETMATILDSNALVIYDFTPFAPLFSSDTLMDNMIPIAEYAKLHDRSKEMIKMYCQQGRIKGAKNFGRYWLIPRDAPYPVEPYNLKRKS